MLRRGWTAWPVALLLLTLPAPALGQDGVDLSDVGYVLGDPEAAVTVVEFGDFACSACAEFHRDTWPSLLRDYVEAGKVRWRHVPFLLGFPKGDDAAKAAECAADQGRYWPMHDLLFLRQAEWMKPRRPESTLASFAAELGLEPVAFAECYDDDHGEERTKRATRSARDLGIRATPTFFIDGFRVQGALDEKTFAGLLDDALARRAGG